MALNETSTLQAFLINSSEPNNISDVSLLPRRSALSIGFSSVTVGIICIVTILGNVAVIYAILTTYEMREKVSNIFLINLSITDLSNALFIMFSAFICIALDFYQVNATWCNFMCAINYCLIIVSMMTLALISIDRLLSVLFPFKYYSLVTKGRVIAVIVVTWIQGAVFGIAPATQGWVHYDYWEAICAINWHQEPRSGPINYVLVAFAICFILPALTMLVCYTVTIRYAKKSLKTMIPMSSSTSNNDDGKESRKQNKEAYLGLRTITSLLVVVALFFFFLTPFSVTKLLKVLTNDPLRIPPYVNLWSAFFAYLSSMVNPFIYGIFRADFRQAYKLMFRKIAARKESRNAESSFAAGIFKRSATSDESERQKGFTIPGGHSAKVMTTTNAKKNNVLKVETSTPYGRTVDSNKCDVFNKRRKCQKVIIVTALGHNSRQQETITKVSS